MELKRVVAVAGLLMLTGCEYRANPDELTGEYRRPGSNERLILKADGTATVLNMPGHDPEMQVSWHHNSQEDEHDCTWIDFEPMNGQGIEWHTCANRVLTRNTVFIGYPGVDPDDANSFYEKVGL